MRLVGKLVVAITALALISLVGASLYLVLVPPALLQVGAGYSSKIVCSSTLLSGRDPDATLEVDVQAAGNPLFRGYVVDTDNDAGTVRSAFLRFIAPMGALRRPGLGCATVPGGDFELALALSAPPSPGPSTNATLWPGGEGVSPDDQKELVGVLNDEALTGQGMRAIVVVKDGRIVAERYGQGFDAQTRLLGWSMTKTVTALLVGTVVDQGSLTLDQDGLLPQWAGDERAKITVRQLLAMSSGLDFNEDYGDVSDVNRMLFLEPDMAAFAASFPLEHAPGTFFSYSTGTTVLLSRIWQNALGDLNTSLAWPRKVLFEPIGMNSAVLEADATGTFVGSSYLYATARDWARFGLLLMNGGAWSSRQIVSRDFVKLMVTPAKTNPVYGQGQVWLYGKEDSDFEGDDLKYGIPDDAIWMRGHDGQTVTIVPSMDLIVVRMGLTPRDLGYRSQSLVGALVKALEKE